MGNVDNVERRVTLVARGKWKVRRVQQITSTSVDGEKTKVIGEAE